MNINKNTFLKKVPLFDNDEIATFHMDGTPLSHVYDNVWDFSGQERVTERARFGFATIDAKYRKSIQATLLFFMKERKNKNKTYAKLSVVRSFRQGLVLVSKGLNGCNWAELSDDVTYRAFKNNMVKYINDENLKVSTVDVIIRTINKLNELEFCARPVSRDDFRQVDIKLAQQHVAIPIKMYQKLISEAINIVATYHPHRKAISDIQSLAEEIYEEEAKRLDVVLGLARLNVTHKIDKLSHSIPNFKVLRNGYQLNYILSACGIIILAFSGMRKSEMYRLSKRSFLFKGTNKIPILQGEETKRNGFAVRETWQTHAIVKDALELAYDATQYLRDIYNEKNKKDLDCGKISKLQFENNLNQINSVFLITKVKMRSTRYNNDIGRFFKNTLSQFEILATQEDVEEFNRINPTRAGELKVGETLPKLTPHDLRRSFAVFFKRYGFGSTSTIKFQYKHRSIYMSEYYSNNARLQAMEDVLLDYELLGLMNEEGISTGVDIFDEIYNKSKCLSGSAGKRIYKDRFDKLGHGQHVYMTRDDIERLVRNGTMSVVKLPTGGYCVNSSCTRVCGIGVFAAEKKPCEYQVITDDQAKEILRQNKRLIKVFRELNTGEPMMNSILIGQKQKIKRNETLIKDFDLNFEPFDERIKGIIE
ncbi:hypothetical protein [Vibrio sp. THAF190c]|uniref:hypothetical protein n=1 Tax=Vibrio sp. THAF190c TaxID=2587865 RepID=UPI0012AA6D7E|nr:hypothetical protein [Vibrio sp. THAF190c]QFT12978.1 hypothetical protein FIV04_23845 [Vibrio sp. THAF190c]